MRVILDTKFLIGALITKGTPPDRLYRAWLRGELELVTSMAQPAELANVLFGPASKGFPTQMKHQPSSRISAHQL